MALTRIWSEQAALAGGADAGSSTSQPEKQISLHIHGRARRHELLSESQVP
jgi:hypothetical protein